MTSQRLIIEMGQGVDLHGRDMTKAAVKAVKDAMSRSALPILGHLAPSDIEIRVTIGVCDPNAVDVAAIAPLFPVGQVLTTIVQGGLEVATQDGQDPYIVATAAVEVMLPSQA